MKRSRGLSDRFISDLKKGVLRPLLDRALDDATLDLEIRENYINIYYRGGSLLKVSPAPRRPSCYVFKFDLNYFAKGKSSLVRELNSVVTPEDGIAQWVQVIPTLKDTMDLWFGKHPKDERALQQMVVWENNDSAWAGGTDWFVVDIEYDNHHGARFDLVAMRWDSVASARKLTKGYIPRLAVIEMKAGDGALTGDAGIAAHLDQLRGFFADKKTIAEFKTEMLNVFQQKRDLGLIRALRTNKNSVKALDAEMDLVFLFAGHDPASRKLGRILGDIAESKSAQIAEARICLCCSSLMGYGLYKENVRELKQFLVDYAEQIEGC